MNKTFTVMKSNVGTNIQDTSTAMATVIGNYINDIYFDLQKRFNWDLIDHDYTLTTVASQQFYSLPANFGKELYVLDSTNGLSLVRESLPIIYEKYPATLGSTGTVERYAIFKSPVKMQPTATGTLSVVSSDASDTTQTVFVRGISSGVEVGESISLNGLTPVVSSNSYSEIISISKSASTTGKVTITSGSDTLAVIAPSVLDYKVTLLMLHAVPSQALVLKIPYKIAPSPLSEAYDVPLFDFGDLIEKGATMMALRYKRQYAKADDWERDYEKGIQNTIWSEVNQPNMAYKFNVKSYPRDIY